MEITDLFSGEKRKIIITKVNDDEFTLVTRKRYFFDWKKLKSEAVIYKLQAIGDDDILGVLALIEYEAELRIEIKLLAVSKENVGSAKRYAGIAGCLIAFTCRQSVSKYGALACISLVPKTNLVKHYIQQYNMKYAGWQLFLDGIELQQMLRKYGL
jgi:hypothetical protein